MERMLEEKVIPLHFLQVIKGQENAKEEFIAHYFNRTLQIIERVKEDKLRERRNKIIYNQFQDKLPSIQELTYQSLCRFAETIDDNMVAEPSTIWSKMRSFIIEYVEDYFKGKSIKNFIHKELKNICKGVKDGFPSASDKLKEYEKNVLYIIQDKTKTSANLCSDHVRVSEAVMREWINQAKKYGDKDTKGKDVNNYYNYLCKIIKSRMYDQGLREGKVYGYSMQDDEKMGFASAFFYPNSISNDEKIFNKQLETILGELFRKLKPVEQFIIDCTILKDMKAKEVIDKIEEDFGETFTPFKLSRTKGKALERLKELFLNRLKDWEREEQKYN